MGVGIRNMDCIKPIVIRSKRTEHYGLAITCAEFERAMNYNTGLGAYDIYMLRPDTAFGLSPSS